MQPSIEYLGMCVDATEIHPNKSKVEAVTKVAAPRNLKELQTFMGMIGYYRKFIPNLASKVKPLYDLSTKRVLSWSQGCVKAFKGLKDDLTFSDMLVHFYPDKPIRLALDASSVWLRAVISHEVDGDGRAIAFQS